MKEKPSVILLYGDDGLAMELEIDRLVKLMGDPTMAEMNTSRLDGRRCTLEDVRSAALSLPFLAERRLVILSNPLPLAGKVEPQTEQDTPKAAKENERKKKFIQLLEEVPPSTALVLQISDEKRGQYWDVMKQDHWLLKWTAANPGRAWRQECQKPTHHAMPGWIQKQARDQGGEFTAGAARALTEHTGSETGLACQEIAKLLTYTQFSRAVTVEDVELLVTPGGPVVIFDVIDALAEGRAPQAMRLLHDLLDTSAADQIFSMVIRQFRILIQVREVLDEGGGIERAKSELAPLFIFSKIIDQARLFNMNELIDIHHRLLEIDRGVKLSQTTYELGLELLVTSLERK